MGSEESQNYNNDPYIQQSNLRNNQINNFYTQSPLVPFSQSNPGITKESLIKQQKTINTQMYINPIKFDKDSIKFENDAYDLNKKYITFNYSCERQIFANFYLNSAFNYQPVNLSYYSPSEKFTDFILKASLNPGKNVNFIDKNVFVDINYFFKNKNYNKNLYDVIIELYVFDINSNNTQVECILSTFCKINYISSNQSFEIKPICQKCKIYNNDWYDIENVYGLASDDSICEICCVNKKNTFFIPCHHSFACNECAIMLRIKGNGCPICRQEISDSIILDDKNLKNV